MSSSEARKKLKDSIENGLSIEIYKAEQAYFLLKAIGNHKPVIDVLENGNFIGLFYTIQMALHTEAILAVSRLYDKKDKKFPTRCIVELLDLVENESSSLPRIRKKHLEDIEIQLQNIGIKKNITRLIYEDQSKFALELSKHFKDILAKPSFYRSIKSLKDIRDKRFAHNENISGLRIPSYDELKKLLDNAKEIVGAIGWLYLDTAYMNNGKYFLSFDAQMHSIAIDSLIEKLVSPHEL
jgi:hypothetical protein